MKDRISSYKLSPQLKAELGVRRSSGKAIDISFEFPKFSSFSKTKLPWRTIAITGLVVIAIVGSYIGVKKTYELAAKRAQAAEEARAKQYQEKLANIRNEIASEGSDPYSFTVLSQKYVKEGNAEKAVAAAEMASEKDPLWRDAYLNLGQVYLSVNEFKKAELALKTALERDPTCGQAHYLMSLTLEELNNKENAKQEFAKAKKFGFESDIGG